MSRKFLTHECRPAWKAFACAQRPASVVCVAFLRRSAQSSRSFSNTNTKLKKFKESADNWGGGDSTPLLLVDSHLVHVILSPGG